MIGFLSGRLIDREPDGTVLLDVGGVGYEVRVPTGVAFALGQLGDVAELHVHTHVREDAIVLYGFSTREQRRCFEALLAGHGVGPSLALAVLSVHAPEALRKAVYDDDLEMLSLVPGIGRKTAQRLCLDLKPRFQAMDVSGSDGTVSTPTAAGDGESGGAAARREVVAALQQLGYGPDEIAQAIRRVDGEGAVQDQLRQALRELAGAGR